ncbi:HET-domain-containing protein [Daldinia eschscholtzii]|nr:HET-domain-containing protein [Daldinia eschscholtzii]
MSKSFQYRPLTEPGEIRLLCLEPAPDREATLKGSFEHIILPDHYFTDPYTALSYVWGDAAAADTILVDGHVFGITANLGAALRDIRNDVKVHHLWADALCINQNDIPERNQQVALMRDIYSSASSTIAHLGTLSPGVGYLLEQVPQWIFGESRTVYDAGIALEEPQGSNSNQVLKITSDVTVGSEDLLARPWFHRAWTFQELVLSRDPWVQCGSRKVRWMDLCKYLVPLLETLLKEENTLERINKVHDAVYTHGNVDPEILNFWRILELRGDSQATDPRDLIYANMGLHMDRLEVGEFVQIDYNKTVREVFVEVGLYVMKYLGLNRAVSNISDSPLRSILPSWVPDWGFDAKLGSSNVEQVDGERHIPLSSEQDMLLIKSKHPPLVVTQVSEILPHPRSPEESGLDNMNLIGGTVYFAKLSHRPIRDAVPKLWEEYIWLRGVLENGGSGPIDWLDSISDDNACDLISKMYDNRLYDPSVPSRIALLDNSVATIVNEKVRVGDSIVALESVYFYQGGTFHKSQQEFPTRIVVRRLESELPSKLDNRVVAMLSPEDKYVGRRQHCRLIAPQVIRIEETTLEQESLLIVH